MSRPRCLVMLGIATLVAGCRDGAKSTAPPDRSGTRTQGADVSSPDERPQPPVPATTDAAPLAVAPGATPAPRAPRFEVAGKQLTDAELEQMIKDGKLRAEMVEVMLASNRLTARALELLAGSPLKTLQLLDISDNPIGDAGAAVIAREPLYRGVNELGLGYTGMSRAGLEVLLGKDSKLTGPTGLGLDGIPLGDEGLDVLLASRFAVNLRTLSLSNTGITDAGGMRLAASAALPNLYEIVVSRNQLSAATIAALRKRKMDFRVHAD